MDVSNGRPGGARLIWMPPSVLPFLLSLPLPCALKVVLPDQYSRLVSRFAYLTDPALT